MSCIQPLLMISPAGTRPWYAYHQAYVELASVITYTESLPHVSTLHTSLLACLWVCAGSSAGKPSNVHMTGTSAAVPEGQVASKSLTSSSTAGDSCAEAPPCVAQRATSQRATSFVGTADYVAPEVMASHC